MTNTGAGTTVHLASLPARVVLVAVSASLALWFYMDAGEPSLPVLALGGLSVMAIAELLARRHLLDLRVDGDEVVIVRRRPWQPRFVGTQETLWRYDIAGVVIEDQARENVRGAGRTTVYRVVLRLASGTRHALTPHPFRHRRNAEEIAREVGHLLGLEPQRVSAGD